VSATHWSIIDRTKGELLFGKRETETRQIASLTKIMTAMVVLDLVKESASNNFAHLDSYVTILESASEMTGTTANLLDRDMLTVEDLIYGMMLPSGNDAA
jgi:D-alanyl-D-alanine carboxypeptidase (penicillin-binding protein 5/6)